MHITKKMKIIIIIMGVIISIMLLTVFFVITENTDEITVDSPKYSVVVSSFTLGSLIGTVSVPTLISTIKSEKR